MTTSPIKHNNTTTTRCTVFVKSSNHWVPDCHQLKVTPPDHLIQFCMFIVDISLNLYRSLCLRKHICESMSVMCRIGTRPEIVYSCSFYEQCDLQEQCMDIRFSCLQEWNSIPYTWLSQVWLGRVRCEGHRFALWQQNLAHVLAWIPGFWLALTKLLVATPVGSCSTANQVPSNGLRPNWGRIPPFTPLRIHRPKRCANRHRIVCFRIVGSCSWWFFSACRPILVVVRANSTSRTFSVPSS